MSSIWKKTVNMPEFPVLAGEIETEVAVIGGGMAGLLTACLLEMRGIDCVVLEANRVGGGVTGGTTAKITSQHGLCYHKLLEEVGFERAEEYAKRNEEAIEAYAQIIENQEIDCDFRRVSTYLYASEANPALEEEYRAAEKLGLSADMVTQTELPLPLWGALRF